MFSKQDYNNILAFMSRANMNGEEAIVFTDLYIKIKEEMKKIDKNKDEDEKDISVAKKIK